MVKIVLIVLTVTLLGTGYFLGQPNLKQSVALMSCDEFLQLKPLSLEHLRGRVALIGKGANMELLADNCATYPGKPMALYFGWRQYLES